MQRYTAEWEKTVTRLGRWIDFKNDYKTMDPEYMESVWYKLHHFIQVYTACPLLYFTFISSIIIIGGVAIHDRVLSKLQQQQLVFLVEVMFILN